MVSKHLNEGDIRHKHCFTQCARTNEKQGWRRPNSWSSQLQKVSKHLNQHRRDRHTQWARMKQGVEMLSSFHRIALHWDVPTKTSNSQKQKSMLPIFFKVTQRMTIRHSFVNKSGIPTGDWKYGRSQVRWGLEVESLVGNSEWLNHHCEIFGFSVHVLLTSLTFPGGILQWWSMWQITRGI